MTIIAMNANNNNSVAYALHANEVRTMHVTWSFDEDIVDAEK